ncbi:MAG: HD domain-containing protein [Solirubrobacteraceae bacterium]
MDAGDLIPGFKPETDLERRVAAEPDLLEGLAWGEPRASHPEGEVGTHVSHLLETLDKSGETGERRELLRFMALVHDSFKYQVRERLPRRGENHHAMRARRFAERFTDDARVLATIELHDRPYALWRKMQRKGKLDERGFRAMMKRIDDPELFLRFIELDGSTEGKRAAPIEWFRTELEKRGVLDGAGSEPARAR